MEKFVYNRKETFEYKPLPSSKTNTHYDRWLEKNINKNYKYVKDVKSYKKYIRNKTIFYWIFFIVLVLFLNLFLVSYETWPINASFWNTTTHEIICIVSVSLAIIDLFCLLIGSYFKTLFFYEAQKKYLKSDEYKKKAKQFNTLQKIKYFNLKKVKILLKLQLINKVLYEVYLKSKKST